MNKYLKSVLVGLLISTQAFAGLPPTSAKGQSETSAATTFFTQAPNSQFTTTAGVTRLIETGNENELANPNFQASSVASAWTVTNSSASADATNFLSGKQSLLLTLSAQTGVLLTQSVTATKQVGSQNWEYTINIKTALTTIVVCALQNATEITSTCVNATSDGNWHAYTINYPANSTSNGIEVKASSSSTGTLNLNKAYLGAARNIGSAAQAYLVGTVTITGCSTSFSSTVGQTTFGAMTTSPPTGCVYTVTGQALAPTSTVPGIRFASLPAGDYQVEYEGGATVRAFDTSGNYNYLQFTDGTNTCRETSLISNPTNVANVGQSGISQSISYTTNQTNVTLQVYSKTDNGSGGQAYLNGTTARPGVIKVWYFPSQSQQVFNPALYQSSWSGYHNSISGGCGTTSSSYADPSACTGITLNQITNTNFGTVTTAAGSLPGITFTPTYTGIYSVCASPTITAATQTIVTVRLVDGSSVVIDPAEEFFVPTVVATSPSGSVRLCGLYNVTSIAATTIKIQLASNSGPSASVLNSVQGPAINWQIINLTRGLSTPVLTGGITSNSSNAIKFESASIAAPSAGTCAVTTQNNAAWISGTPTSAGTGRCAIVFSSGWSAAPQCYAQNNTTSSYVSKISSAATTSGIEITMVDSSAQTASSQPFNIMCFGPR